MKIAVNVRFLVKDKLEGIGVFTFEALKQLVIKHPEHRFYFIFDRPFSPEFIFADNIIPVVAFPPARHPFLWFIWFEFSLPRILKKIKAEIFISADGFLPLNLKIPSLAIIHDIAFEHYPETVPGLVRKYYHYFFPRFAQKADRIATVSDFTKTDICLRYGINPEKIDVIYNGADDSFQPLTEEQKSKVKNELTGGKDYFIYIGALHPRKNIENLLKAYDIFRDNYHGNIRLVIAGRKAWKTAGIEETYRKMTFRDDVIFTGRIPDNLLKLYLGSALALTYVSFFEGFGLPLIEAYYCHVPAITSNCTSLPEAGGDAALYADPFVPAEIAAQMLKMTENETRNILIANTFKFRQKYNWNRTSDLLWDSIQKTFNNKINV